MFSVGLSMAGYIYIYVPSAMTPRNTLRTRKEHLRNTLEGEIGLSMAGYIYIYAYIKIYCIYTYTHTHTYTYKYVLCRIYMYT